MDFEKSIRPKEARKNENQAVNVHQLKIKMLK